MAAASGGSSTHPAAAPAALEVINRRYRIVRSLGQGGMGAVYLALDDEKGGRQVALKRVRGGRLDARTLSSLQSEFLTLARLRHPNLASAYDFGADQATKDIFFTSEYVEGLTWRKQVQDLDLGSRPGLLIFLDLAVQVLRVLGFIHSRGLVHGDIKPENVLIRRMTPAAPGSDAGYCAKLIDFGLVRKEKDFGGKRILGTTYYIAPETILGGRVDRRTDLYSLGVVLYHLASGELPFRGRSNLAVFKGHLEQTPAPPHELSPRVPRELGDVILRLMEKRPADRFQNAGEVIDEINHVFGVGFPLETAETIETLLESVELAGREEDFAKLSSLFAPALQIEAREKQADDDSIRRPREQEAGVMAHAASHLPAGRLVFISGERGLGKRRFFEETRRLAQVRGATVLEVECSRSREEELGDFLELADKLEVFCASLGVRRGGSIVERARGAAAVRLEGKAVRDERSAEELMGLAGEVASTLLDACRECPLLLHLHDIHEAGKPLLDVVRRLVELLAAGRAGGSRLLITASTLDHGDTEGTQLRHLFGSQLFRRSVLELKLERLDKRGVAELVRSALVGIDLPEKLLERMVDESDGNPDAVLDVLGRSLRRGWIQRTPSGWVVERYEGEALPGKARLELKARIESLSPQATRLATAFACLGPSGELALAARLAGIPQKNLAESLSELKRARLIEERLGENQGDLYSFVHTSARDILHGRMSAAERARAHEQAGVLREELCRAEGCEQPVRLAHHFLRSGNREKGVRYGLAAARAHARELRPLRAIALYEEVLGLAPAGDEDLARRVREEIAALRLDLGEPRAAIEILSPLTATGPPPSSVCLLRARAHALEGSFQAAAVDLQEALASHQEQAPANLLADVLLSCAELDALKGRPIESLRSCERLLAKREQIGDPLRLFRLCLLLAENHFRLDDSVRAASCCQEALRALDGQTDARSIHLNLLCLARYYRYKGKSAKALQQLEFCLQASRRTGIASWQADCLLEMGSIHLDLERPREALPLLQECKALEEKSGSLPRLLEVLCLLADAHRLVGEGEEARQVLEDCWRHATALGNRRALVAATLAYASLLIDAGDLTAAEQQIEQAEARCGPSSSQREAVRLAELRFTLALYRGELGAALDLAAKGLAECRHANNVLPQSALLWRRALLHARLGKKVDARRVVVALLEIGQKHSWPLADARARWLDAVLLGAEGKLQQARKGLEQAAERFHAEGSERDLVELYLEQGLAERLSGNHEQARLFLEEGYYLAKRLNLEYLLCRYNLSAAVLDLSAGDPQAASAEERLRRAERQAVEAPYRELLWQIQHHLGKLLEETGRETEGKAHRTEAQIGLRATLDDIPLACRRAYLKSVGLDERAAAAPRAAGERQPAREAPCNA